MTQIDDILDLVRTGAIIPETNVAILAREIERLRGENAALKASAGRVLREGQAAIGIYELGMLRDFAARRMSQREHDRIEAVRDEHEAALRAST